MSSRSRSMQAAGFSSIGWNGGRKMPWRSWISDMAGLMRLPGGIVRGMVALLKAGRSRQALDVAMIVVMDTILDRPWTTDSFLAWEDRQESKHEFDGQRVIPMTGGTIAHQRIVANIWLALLGLLEGKPLMAVQEMRLRIGQQIRYPDVV